jgi:hypothetical protein
VHQDPRDCISVYMRCWQASSSLDHGSGPAPPQDCWSVSSSGSWPGSFDSGWRWVCAWRPCGVVDRCHCSPLATRRDTLHPLAVCVHGPTLRRRWGWLGWWAQRCSAVNPGSLRDFTAATNGITTLSLVSACSPFWATHQHRVQKAPCLFVYRCH